MPRPVAMSRTGTSYGTGMDAEIGNDDDGRASEFVPPQRCDGDRPTCLHTRRKMRASVYRCTAQASAIRHYERDSWQQPRPPKLLAPTVRAASQGRSRATRPPRSDAVCVPPSALTAASGRATEPAHSKTEAASHQPGP